jgi:hypothetical protein
MKRILISAAALTFVLALVRSASAQDLAQQVVGTWEIKTYMRKDVETGKLTPVYGTPIGHTVYTRGGHWVSLYVKADRAMNTSPTLTDAEAADALKTMVSFSGTYTVKGDTLTRKVTTAYIPSWAGKEQIFKVKVTGKTMSIETEPFESQIDRRKIVAITTWERLE